MLIPGCGNGGGEVVPPKPDDAPDGDGDPGGVSAPPGCGTPDGCGCDLARAAAAIGS